MSEIIAGLIGFGAGLVIALLLPRKSCPSCAAPLPKIRWPVTANQAAFGGWVCKACGTSVNRKGQPL